MRVKRESRPLGAGGGNEAVPAGHRALFYFTPWPVALQIRKRGRWVTVGKVVEVAGRPVLATAVRHQRGTADVVSMPLVAIEYAERCGCRWWLYRNDRDGTMRRIALADLRQKGWLQADGELYVRLKGMEPCEWRPWAYVEDTVRLDDDVGLTARQLGLMEVV